MSTKIHVEGRTELPNVVNTESAYISGYTIRAMDAVLHTDDPDVIAHEIKALRDMLGAMGIGPEDIEIDIELGVGKDVTGQS